MSHSVLVQGVKDKLIAAIMDIRDRDVNQSPVSDSADELVADIRINELIVVAQDEVKQEAVQMIKTIAQMGTAALQRRDAQIATLKEQTSVLSQGIFAAADEIADLELANMILTATVERSIGILTEANTRTVRAEEATYRAKVDNTLLTERIAELEAQGVVWQSGDSAPQDGTKFYGLWLNPNDAPEIATIYFDVDDDDFSDDFGNITAPDFWMPLSKLPVPERYATIPQNRQLAVR